MFNGQTVKQMAQYYKSTRSWKLVAMRFQTTEQEPRRAVRQWQLKRKSRS